jgi:hypothetical protein
VVSSINDAHERNERTNHEMNNRLRDLKTAEAEVYSLTSERERMAEEMELMKSRVREMMLEKLSAERKMSEAIARNTRNEVIILHIARSSLPPFLFLLQSTIDNWKLRAEKAELELGRKERAVQEQQVMITDLKAKRAESDRQRLLLLEKNAGVAPSSPHQSREDRREEELELIQLRQVKEILEKELGSLKKSLKAQRETNAEQLAEIKRLHEEVGVLKRQKDLFQMDLMKQQSSRTEYQLNELRKDISETTLNWEITEQHQQKFQGLAERYQELIRREQDKVVLLETQNRLLEERMATMSQELSIFRSLDIYEATVSTEMKRYHESKSPLTLRRPEREVTGRKEEKIASAVVSSDEDDDEDYHERVRGSWTGTRSLSSPQSASSDREPPSRGSQTLRGKGARNPPPLVSWKSEMKGEDSHNARNEEDEVGPGLAMQDMTPSPSLATAYNFPRRALPTPDSKQLTPSLSRLTEERERVSSTRTQAFGLKQRDSADTLSWMHQTSSSRQGVAGRREQEGGTGRVSESAFTSRSLGHDKVTLSARTSIVAAEHPASRSSTAAAASPRPSPRLGGLTPSARPSKDEFERAKRLLSKR